MRFDLNTLLLCLVILAHGYASRIPSGAGVSIVATVVNIVALALVAYCLIR